MVLRILLDKIRLQENEGTHNTSVMINVFEILTLPICITKSNLPFSSLTCVEITAVIEVKSVIELTMWSVAPVSMIQDLISLIPDATLKDSNQEKMKNKTDLSSLRKDDLGDHLKHLLDEQRVV